MYLSIPNQTRSLRATEAILDRVYIAAKRGLKGDTLALAAGLRPSEYKALCAADEMVPLAAQQGKADLEMEMAGVVVEAARAGDAKSALAMLQHVHGWQAKGDAQVNQGGGINIIIQGVETPQFATREQTQVTVDG